jgi:hypothetical protein
MVVQAERELAMGHFVKAATISRKAGLMVKKAQDLHRRFMDLLRKAMERTDAMEDMGYDVSEARALITTSRDMAMKSDYESALARMKSLKKALNRATYLPFPLLNKNVDILSTAFWSGSAVEYSVRIENPSSEPLGEIIIRPFFEDGMFHDVQERDYGNIGPRSFSESTFRLVPRGKEFDIGIDSHLLKEESIVFRTRFTSRHGKAAYSITVENNSDQILRDVGLVPRPPGGLVADPQSSTIEFVEPFGSRTVDFQLSPSTGVEDRVVPEEVRTLDAVKERVVPLEDNEFMVVETPKVIKPEEPRPIKMGSDGRSTDSETWDDIGIEEGQRPQKGVPMDFTPQDEDYDLMLMSPYSYPDSYSRAKGRAGRKKADEQDQEMEESE